MPLARKICLFSLSNEEKTQYFLASKKKHSILKELKYSSDASGLENMFVLSRKKELQYWVASEKN